MGETVRHPDPEEPWRYRCPNCGSVSVHANMGNGFSTRPRDCAYRCRKPCGWRGERVVDAKTDQLADPSGNGGESAGAVPKEASIS